jgi:rhodanese-related sulfurtransferase
MKNTSIILIVLMFLAVAGCNQGNATLDQMIANAEKKVKVLTPDEVLSFMESDTIYTLIDVRQKEEHYYGYVPGSVLIPRGSIEFNMGNKAFWEEEGLYMPEKKELIILYCKKGKRSLLAAQTLGDLGYEHVYIIKDGWKNWELTYPDYCEKNLDMLSGGNHEVDTGGC